MTSIRVNGEPQSLPAAATIVDLLCRQGIQPEARGAAVAVNGRIVPRREWATRSLSTDDDVEIVRPYAGG